MLESSPKVKQSLALNRFVDLPEMISFENDVKEVVEYKKQSINEAIEKGTYHNNMIRRLEEEDEKQRKSLNKKMQQRELKNKANLEKVQKQKEDKSEMAIKHIDEVYKKHLQILTNNKQQKDQMALKLRQSLLKFYEKEHRNKIKSLRKQATIPSCYQESLERIKKKHQQSEEHASKSERQIVIKMAKNSDNNSVIFNLTQAKSMENKKKLQIYFQNCEILSQKEKRYIQAHCNVLETSVKAFQSKDISDEKTKQRIKSFFQERTEKWQGLKKRRNELDESKSMEVVYFVLDILC